MNWPILSLTTFLPTVGALVILLLARGSAEVQANTARWVALWTTLVTLALAIVLWIAFDPTVATFQFEEKVVWFAALDISYHMGVDGISILFVVLSAFLMPLCVLASWESVQSRVKEYMVAFLILETLMIGMFCALDYLVFYVFFEAVLIPMFIIIGIWGSGQRRI